MSRLISIFFLTLSATLYGQPHSGYWQQHVDYTMDVALDASTHKVKGKQKLVYTNNSPDTLTKAYYHLYFNAFQPHSMMDEYMRDKPDPDSRVRDRILYLKPDEIGYQHILSLKQDGKSVKYEVDGTILIVNLAEAIKPGKKTTFEMEFESQVPVQIRRSGRDSEEGVAYSMTQWYPKLCEYDYMGWHTNPYLDREFFGVWGNFDVKITLDSAYTIGGTGILQNPEEIGHGYGERKKEPKGNTLTWHFKASNVHDFAWAADDEYTHTTAQVPNGPLLHFIRKDKDYSENWDTVTPYVVRSFDHVNKTYGKYPYDEYTFIQGGDGGMEYPMATLIVGSGSIDGLYSVMLHEFLHSWYQGVLGTNESLYPWMDEGFTSFAQDETKKVILAPDEDVNPQAGNYRTYIAHAKSGNEEPMTTHADMYKTRRASGRNAYTKGAVYLAQLRYILGEETFSRGMRRYYNTWKFKHPTPTDFLRIMEKESGLQLDWYNEQFINTTHQIDYGIEGFLPVDNKTLVTLKRHKAMMMPIDLYVEYTDGTEEVIYLPLRIMRGGKPLQENWKEAAAWPWTNREYVLEIDRPFTEIKAITIDKNEGMADVNPENDSITPGAIPEPYREQTK